MKKYYGISAIRGYGVYTDYRRAMSQKKFLPAMFRIKKFSTLADARNWAQDKFLEFQKKGYGVYEIDELEKTNWTYYRKDKIDQKLVCPITYNFERNGKYHPEN